MDKTPRRMSRLLALRKLAAMRTQAFFTERHGKGDRAAFRALLTRDGGQPPQPGDEMPDGWRA